MEEGGQSGPTYTRLGVSTRENKDVPCMHMGKGHAVSRCLRCALRVGGALCATLLLVTARC